MKINKTFALKYSCFLVIGAFIVIPSSFLAVLKYLFLLGMFFSTLQHMAKNGVQKQYVLVFVLISFISVFFICYSLFLGYADNSDALIPIRNIYVIFLIIFCVSYAHLQKAFSYGDFINIVLNSVFMYGFSKFLLFLLIVLGVVDIQISLSFIESLMPGVVTQIFSIEAKLFRLASASDIILAIVFCLTLIKPNLFEHRSKAFLYVFSFIAVFVVIQSYTRFLWAMILFVLLVKPIFYAEFTKIIKFTCLTALCLCAAYMLFPNVIEGIYSISITRAGDVHSLDTKYLQTQALLNEFSDYPVLGKGAGAYVPDLIRSNEQKFQYENQWAGFLLQNGIIGVVLLLLLPAFIVIKSFNKFSRTNVLIISVFLIFILSGITNPNLTIISMSSVYLLFYLYPYNQKRF